jgi:hypothetical protein
MIVLPGAGIVNKKSSQRLPRQHVAVDGNDLMGERIDFRPVNRYEGIKEVGKVNPLGNQAEKLTVSIEAPWAASFDDFE